MSYRTKNAGAKLRSSKGRAWESVEVWSRDSRSRRNAISRFFTVQTRMISFPDFASFAKCLKVFAQNRNLKTGVQYLNRKQGFRRKIPAVGHQRPFFTISTFLNMESADLSGHKGSFAARTRHTCPR